MIREYIAECLMVLVKKINPYIYCSRYSKKRREFLDSPKYFEFKPENTWVNPCPECPVKDSIVKEGLNFSKG